MSEDNWVDLLASPQAAPRQASADGPPLQWRPPNVTTPAQTGQLNAPPAPGVWPPVQADRMAQHERPAPSAQPPPAAPENQQPFDVEALAASLPQQAPTSARAARPSKPKEPNPFFTLEGEGGSEAGTDEGGAGEDEGEEDERPADLKEVPVLSINELAPPSPTSANHMSASSATSANSSARAPATAAAHDPLPLGSATRLASPSYPARYTLAQARRTRARPMARCSPGRRRGNTCRHPPPLRPPPSRARDSARHPRSHARAGRGAHGGHRAGEGDPRPQVPCVQC